MLGATSLCWSRPTPVRGKIPTTPRQQTATLYSRQGARWPEKAPSSSSVVLSSSKVECTGQSKADTQTMRTRRLPKELKINGTLPKNVTVIYADNQRAISLAENRIFQRRSKHTAVKYHFTRDLIEKGETKLEYKLTKEMVAGGLTKPLWAIAFEKLVGQLGLPSVDTAASKLKE